MNSAAELAAECMRIYDLLSAGDEPMTPDDWDRVVAALRAVAGRASELREFSADPQPRIVDGIGLCSVHCSHYFEDTATKGCRHGGDGTLQRVTASMVPCRPWVDQQLEALRKAEQDWHGLKYAADETETKLRREIAGWKSAVDAGADMISHLKQKLQEKTVSHVVTAMEANDASS